MGLRWEPDLPKASLLLAESGTASSIPSTASTRSPRNSSPSAPNGRATDRNSSRITGQPSRCRALVSDDLFTPDQDRNPLSPAFTSRRTSR